METLRASTNAARARSLAERPRLLTTAVAAAVALAFADSSIVVLALPRIYGQFETSIVGVSWVITSYNLVVALVAFALVPVVGRADAGLLSRVGLGAFLVGSVGSAASPGLAVLIAFRCVQGAGAAMLLAASLALLSTLTGSAARATAIWTAAGTFGLAVGPALGGVLTQFFDWRAIFGFQAPIAALALLAARETHSRAREVRERRRLAPNLGLAFVFGGLVGALFLGVLLVVAAWRFSPVGAAAMVSALPLAALASRRLVPELSPRLAAGSGSGLLVAGLVALSLLPATSAVIVAVALALCGGGLGLAIPVLTRAAVDPETGSVRSATITIGARHAGLVLALALVAPLLSRDLVHGARQARLGGTKAILDGDISLRQKLPIALDVRNAIDSAPKGVVPDLAAPFDRRGAAHDEHLREVRTSVIAALEGPLTRSFRRSFVLSALLALLAVAPIVAARRLSGG